MLHVQLPKLHKQQGTTTIDAFSKFGENLVNFQMANALETPRKMHGRGRGLLLVWRRELERKLHVNRYLPRQSKGATLKLWLRWTGTQGADRRQLT